MPSQLALQRKADKMMQDLCADPQASVRREAAQSKVLLDAVEVRSHSTLACTLFLYLVCMLVCMFHKVHWLLAAMAVGATHISFLLSTLQFLTLLSMAWPLWEYRIHAQLEPEMSFFCATYLTLVGCEHIHECIVKVKADDGEDAEEDEKQQHELMWTLDEEVVADCMQR